MKKIKHLLEFVLFVSLSVPLAVLPLALARKAGAAIGVLAYSLWGRRRRIAIENLSAAVGRGALNADRAPEGIIRENFMNMGRSIAELVKVYFGLGGGLIDSIKIEGMEHLKKARAGGRGVIFITGHCGNWELWALSMPRKTGGRAYGVARRQSNPFVNAFIVRVRERYGGSVIYKEGALKKIMAVLKEGGSVGVVMDQAVMPDEGVLIDFLGAPAWTTKMPAAMAKRTSAAVLPTFIYMDKSGYVIRMHPEVELTGDEAADTKKMSAYIENYIRQDPSQWLWMHRRWKRAPRASEE